MVVVGTTFIQFTTEWKSDGSSFYRRYLSRQFGPNVSFRVER